MNMNADQPDFESLRRLLKLKRHEQPPPRYFNDFSGQVLNRIKAGRPEGRDDDLEHLALAPPWWQKILAAFRDEPLFAGACAAAVCALLVAGAIYTERLESNPAALGFGGLETQALVPSAPVLSSVSPLAINRTNSDSSLSGLFDIRVPAWPAGYRLGGQ